MGPFTSPVANVDLLGRAGKSCAVVGSSPGLIGKGLGNDIDAHDLVIRFNTAVAEGLEKDKGSRTDVRLTGKKSSLFYEDCNEIVLNMHQHMQYGEDDVGWILPMEPVFYFGASLSVAC